LLSTLVDVCDAHYPQSISPTRLHLLFDHFSHQVFMASPSGTPDDNIYFVKTHTPHIHDFRVDGPFKHLEAIIPAVRERLRSSAEGLRRFNELLLNHGVGFFTTLTASLPSDDLIHITLQTEDNAAVKALLPGPTWMVLVARAEPGAGAQHYTTKELCIYQTFTSFAGANSEARMVADRKMAVIVQGKRKSETADSAGNLTFIVVGKHDAFIVTVRYEEGRR
jgi:hypothetical protein